MLEMFAAQDQLRWVLNTRARVHLLYRGARISTSDEFSAITKPNRGEHATGIARDHYT